MSYVDERASIEGRWRAQWVTGSPSSARTPTRYETQTGFTPPTSDPWVSLFINPGSAEQASIGAPGSNAWRHAGAVMIQIRVPLAGSPLATRRAEVLADHAMGIFRGASFDGIRCMAPYISGRQTDDPWYQVTVAVPFTRDTIA